MKYKSYWKNLEKKGEVTVSSLPEFNLPHLEAWARGLKAKCCHVIYGLQFKTYGVTFHEDHFEYFYTDQTFQEKIQKYYSAGVGVIYAKHF